MDRQPNWGAAAVEDGWRKGTWSAQEDKLLIEHVNLHGEGSWNSVSKQTGLKRSGKSCRLRWVNYLSPDLKRGKITPEEESIIIQLHALWGNRWSAIARSLPGRTDNEIKNYWRTHFKKRSSSKRVEKARAELLRQRQEQRKHEEERHQDVQQQQQQEDSSVGMIMNQVEQVAVARDMQQEMDCYMYPFSDMLQGGGAVGSIGDGSSSAAEGSCGSLWHLDDMLAEIEGAHGGGLQVQDQVLAFHSEELLWREHIM